MHRLTLVVSLALSTLACPNSAQAQAQAQAQASEESRRERARELLLDGTEAINTGDLQQARRLLSEALQLMPSYDTAAALGQAELELGLYDAAAKHLDLSLRTFPPSESPELKEKLKQGFSKAKQHTATLSIEASPEGAEVLVDGVVVGVAPLKGPLFVPPGPHHLEARITDAGAGANAGADAEPMRQTVQAVAGREHQLVLHAAPAAEAGPKAGAERRSTEPTDTTTLAGPPVAPAEADDGDRLIPVYVGAGLSAVALATGIVFAVRSNSKENDANVLRDSIKGEFGDAACANRSPNNTADCQALESALDDWRSNEHKSNVFFWTSAGFAAATLATYLLWPDPKTPMSAQVQPLLSPNGSGISLQGTF
jgi:tetratricopeptide (TPR) repeat protein